MKGAIVGDIVGSVYEGQATLPGRRFPLFRAGSRFTDDTVLTVATADALLGNYLTYDDAYAAYFKKYPKVGYGELFYKWANSKDHKPYNSYGNGSAMRVSPVAYFCPDGNVEEEAQASAEVTHNHRLGIYGAQAVACAVWFAWQGSRKDQIENSMVRTYHYNLSMSVDDLAAARAKDVHGWKPTCQETVPQALVCFLDSDSFEDAIRNAVSIGGDTDTTACITGAIAEAFYGGVPDDIWNEAKKRLDGHLLGVTESFCEKYVRFNYGAASDVQASSAA